jgi:uncharacterized protein YjiS (DUF1127 family)
MSRTTISRSNHVNAPIIRHIRGLWHSLGQTLALRRQRSQLMTLDDHLLNDIGLTRATAMTEAQRPLWDAPTRWRADAKKIAGNCNQS